MVAVADFVPSSVEVAVIVAVCPAVAVSRTVTRPFAYTVATAAALVVQVTVSISVPVTVATSCSVSPGRTVALAGATVTIIGSLGCNSGSGIRQVNQFARPLQSDRISHCVIIRRLDRVAVQNSQSPEHVFGGFNVHDFN